MSLSQRAWALVNVRAEETKLVQLLLLLAALTGAGKLLSSTAAYALFLETFDAQRLPFIYIGTSIGSTLISLLYLRIEKRYTIAHLLTGQLGFIILTLVGYRAGLAFTTNPWMIFSLPIYDGVVSILLYTAFWNVAGRIFNLQQGKRLFSLFGASQELAVVVVGLFLPLIVKTVGTVNLLGAAAVAGASALVVLLLIIRNAPTVRMLNTDEADTTATEEEAPAPRNWLADPYVMLIFAVCICFGLGDYFVDNIFYARVEGQLTDPDQLAGFLGIFAGIVSGLSLCSHLFLSSYMLRRYGVRTIILLTPLLLLAITTLFVLSGTLSASAVLLFWLAILMTLTGRVTDAFDNIAFNLLYQPLGASIRLRTQTAIDGIIYPGAGGVAGLLLLFLTGYLQLDSLQLAYVLLPLVAIWLVATIALGRAYPRQVQQALRQRLVRGDQIFTPDRISLALLQQHLHSPHPGAILYALELLAAHDRETLHRLLPPLLENPAVEVRRAVIAQMEALGSADQLDLLARYSATDPDDRVRSAALRARGTIGGLAHDESLHEQLTTPNAQLRQGVMVGLLRSGELEGILAVGTQLARLVQSSESAERIFAAGVLGESGVASFYRPLLQLLGDPVPAVQRAALAAAGKLRQPKLWPLVVEALAAAATRSAAQSALVAGGDSALPALAASWASADNDPLRRGTLARTCGRLRSEGAAALLLAELDDPDVSVRSQILAALHQCGIQTAANERDRIESAIQAELAHAAWTLAGILDLADDPALVIVHDALLASLAQQQRRLFHWLSFLYDPAMIRRVRDAFTHATTPAEEHGTEQRAYALEILDLLIVADFKEALLSLYDDQPPLAKLSKLTMMAPQPRLEPLDRLQEIINGPATWLTPWLYATALYKAPLVAATHPDRQSDLAQAVDVAGTAANALIRESAQWAAEQMLSRQALEQ